MCLNRFNIWNIPCCSPLIWSYFFKQPRNAIDKCKFNSLEFFFQIENARTHFGIRSLRRTTIFLWGCVGNSLLFSVCVLVSFNNLEFEPVFEFAADSTGNSSEAFGDGSSYLYSDLPQHKHLQNLANIFFKKLQI